MNSGKMSREDAMELRKLLAYPTGLELHIGVPRRLCSQCRRSRGRLLDLAWPMLLQDLLPRGGRAGWSCLGMPT